MHNDEKYGIYDEVEKRHPTKIFKNYEEFKKRENINVNGVSLEYLDKYLDEKYPGCLEKMTEDDKIEELEKKSKYKWNAGCWNSLDSVKSKYCINSSCEYSYNLKDCKACFRCVNLIDCEWCFDCIDCRFCEYCFECESVYECKHCKNCYNCSSCMYCKSCKNCDERNWCYNKTIKCENSEITSKL